MGLKNIIGVNINTGTFKEYVDTIIEKGKKGESFNVCLANVHMLIEAHQCKNFKQQLNNASLITADGVPLTWASRLLYGIKQERVAGMDLLPAMLNEAQTHKISVFFYGGTNNMLQKTSAYLASSFPDLQIAGMLSPPFRLLSADEEAEVVSQINASGAKLVFVVLGCPKQEKWMASMKGRVQAVMIGIGGALPVIIGLQKRSPKWMQRTGMEWLYRLYREPRRLFKRYAVTNTLFLFLLTKEIIKVHLLKRKLTTT